MTPRQSLLAVDTAWEAACPRAAEAGAFDWWYLDARDLDGTGLVFIWANRLPFFPEELPAVNLCLYRRGKPVFWLLQQQRRDDWAVRAEGDGFAIGLGQSVFSVARAGENLRLEASLDLELPGDRRRLTGTLRASGPCALGDGPALDHPHRWVPLLPVARVSADLRCGREPLFSFDGEGYADRNLGDAPLAALGVRRWSWGRARRGDRCHAWYALEGEDGAAEAFRLDAGPAGMRVWRPPAPERRRGSVFRVGGLVVHRGPRVEQGPFYSRSFDTAWGGAAGDGAAGDGAAGDGAAEDGAVPVIAEECEVSRIGQAWHQPLVRMRVHRVAGPRSFWLPLFTGPREGRVARLFSQGAR